MRRTNERSFADEVVEGREDGSEMLESFGDGQADERRPQGPHGWSQRLGVVGHVTE